MDDLAALLESGMMGGGGGDFAVDLAPVLEVVFAHLESYGYDDRVRYWRPACSRVVCRILSNPAFFMHHPLCWYILHTSLELGTRVNSADPSFEDIDTIAFAVHELGIVQLIADSLGAVRLGGDLATTASLACLTPICLFPQFVPIVLASGLPAVLVTQARARIPAHVGSGMLVVLTNLAIHPESHTALLEAGLGDLAAQELVPQLASRRMDVLDCALSGAFCACRLHLELPTRDTELLARKLKWILGQVVEAGPGGIVLGSRWNPANIVMDLSMLAERDGNLPHLLHLVPEVSNALQAYGAHNTRLVKYSATLLWALFPLQEEEEGANSQEVAKKTFATQQRQLARCFIHALRRGGGGRNQHHEDGCDDQTIDLVTRQALVAMLTLWHRDPDTMNWTDAVMDRVGAIRRWLAWRFPGWREVRNWAAATLAVWRWRLQQQQQQQQQVNANDLVDGEGRDRGVLD